MKHAYLLHTGYGKTKLCLDKIMNAPRKPRTLLISTKNIVQAAWPSEIEKWYPGKITYHYITGDVKVEERLKIVNQPVDILAMNTDMIEWYIKNTCDIERYIYVKKSPEYPDGKKPMYATKVLTKRFDLVIIDEVSLFKNSQSERFKLIKQWCHHVTNVMILSATPTPKDIEDIWAEIYLIDGGQRLGKTITKFREDYAIAVPLPNGHNRYQYSQAVTDHILTLIKDVSTSVPAPAQPLFPEPILKKTLIKADPTTQHILETFKNDFILKLTNGKNIIAFSKTQMINKISQIASGDVYTSDTVVHMNDIKFRYLQMLLNTINTPVLIFYNYIFDKEKLLTLPGARLLKDKKDFEDWNQNKIPIGILSPFSAAHGLNLQDSDCQDLIWFSPIWDTEKWIQTNARVCRRGQKHQVIIRVLLLKGSYDEYAFDLCQDKFKAQYNNLQKLR